MFELNALRARLQPHLGWHGAGILFVAAFIVALFRARTVNLSELSVTFPGRAKPELHLSTEQKVSTAAYGYQTWRTTRTSSRCWCSLISSGSG